MRESLTFPKEFLSTANLRKPELQEEERFEGERVHEIKTERDREKRKGLS